MTLAKKIVTCFYAYPTFPLSLSETIETAIPKLCKTGYVDIIGWKSLGVSGKFVIGKICEAIRKADIFLCDVTNLNPNVLFELGYAIAQDKRVWLSLDRTDPKAESNFKKTKILSTIGYRTYSNSDNLTEGFLSDRPFSEIEETLYRDLIEPQLHRSGRPNNLLYMKSSVETEASKRISQFLSNEKIHLFIDDPSEVSIQTLNWYIEHIVDSGYILVHLIDEERSKANETQNIKYSFLAGLAYGLDRNVLMLAHHPYEPPFDYQQLLAVHKTASEGIELLQPWINQVLQEIQDNKDLVTKSKHLKNEAFSLRKIYIGDYIAENEQDQLNNYFIETAAFSDAIRTNQSMIFVGSKGTGKTATLFQIVERLSSNKDNHLCVLKPVDYDLDGVLRLLRLSIPLSEQGYLMESLWKYLVYTQLAFSFVERINNRSIYIADNSHEQALKRFVEENKKYIQSDFTIRLETAVSNLCNIVFSQETASIRVKVSETLHENLLNQLRKFLGNVLFDKKVYILIDNLDKAWRQKSDLEPLSNFIFGLMSVSRAITEEFKRSGPSWRPSNVSVLVFLRRDIFTFMRAHAREADKLICTSIDWSDPYLLQRIIEERFIFSLDEQITPDTVWKRFFPAKTRNIETKTYLVNHVIPRPRDIIYICKTALAQAVNRGNPRIEEEDIVGAEKEYSEYAFLTLVSEIKPQFPYIEELLVELAGSNEIITYTNLCDALVKLKQPQSDVDLLIQLLETSLFLGIEASPNEFRYLYEHEKPEIIRARAKKVTEQTGILRYKINLPFHAYLEIQS